MEIVGGEVKGVLHEAKNAVRLKVNKYNILFRFCAQPPSKVPVEQLKF